MDRHKLEGLTREELVALAGELGIVRPRSLTVPELIDEIVSRTASNERDKARSRGWLGRARSLLAGVIERGLHLPEVAKALRNAPSTKPWPVAPPPLATMTLAEIYAAQGHTDKALQVLDEILAREPEHADARSFRHRLDPRTNITKQPEIQAKSEDTSPSNDSPVVVEEPQAVVKDEPTPVMVETNVADVAPAEPAVAAPTANPAAVEVSASSVEADVEPTVDDSFEDETSAEFDTSDRPSIEDLPLPERYNVDEIVGIAVDPTTVYVYWEVRPVVLARAHARMPGGAMVMRLISVTPTWDGPIVEQRDLPIDALYGDAYVRGLRAGSNVRIGVGWLAHGEFAPFAIGEPVTIPRKEPAFATASTTARWMPEGALAPVASGQTTVALLASALERAASAPKDVISRPQSPPFDLLAQRWPTFDLGSRGLSAETQRRVARSNLGGSSEQVPGGSSELVRPAEQLAS